MGSEGGSAAEISLRGTFEEIARAASRLAADAPAAPPAVVSLLRLVRNTFGSLVFADAVARAADDSDELRDALHYLGVHEADEVEQLFRVLDGTTFDAFRFSGIYTNPPRWLFLPLTSPEERIP